MSRAIAHLQFTDILVSQFQLPAGQPYRRHGFSTERNISHPTLLQGSSTSIFVIYCPGTTIRPRNRLVMSNFTEVPGSEDASAAALIALSEGGRYS